MTVFFPINSRVVYGGDHFAIKKGSIGTIKSYSCCNGYTMMVVCFDGKSEWYCYPRDLTAYPETKKTNRKEHISDEIEDNRFRFILV